MQANSTHINGGRRTFPPQSSLIGAIVGTLCQRGTSIAASTIVLADTTDALTERAETRSRDLRDGLARYGDGFHAPELIAAIAPAVRSLLGDTLIVIHEAQQLDAARDIITRLRDREYTHRAPDLCLLVTGPRRRGFGFLDESGAGIVHDLPIAGGTTGGAPSAVPGQPASAFAVEPQPRAGPATRLTRFLNAKAKAGQSGLAISLEPDPAAGGSHIKGRLLGSATAVSLLRPGPHFLRHTSAFPAGMSNRFQLRPPFRVQSGPLTGVGSGLSR